MYTPRNTVHCEYLISLTPISARVYITQNRAHRDNVDALDVSWETKDNIVPGNIWIFVENNAHESHAAITPATNREQIAVHAYCAIKPACCDASLVRNSFATFHEKSNIENAYSD